jgi:hypothetical protein
MKDKKERFITLGEKRVVKTMKYIELIGNLGNTSNYEYSNEQVKKIFSELETALKSARSKFVAEAKKGVVEKEFRLG